MVDQLNLEYGFDQSKYCIPLCNYKKSDDRRKQHVLIKLADFGTSSINIHEINNNITVNHFNTLENTPIEYLLLGSYCRQSYSADTYCLGLCYFHLLSGYEPYEVLLAEVKCPTYLVRKLKKLFDPKKRNQMDVDGDSARSIYTVVQTVIESLQADDDEEPGAVFYDTLYRYFVMFYKSTDLNSVYLHELRSIPLDSGFLFQALNIVCDALGLQTDVDSIEPCASVYNQDKLGDASKVLASNEKNTSSRYAVNQYIVDRHMWSVEFGEHLVMQRYIKCR